MATPYYKIKVGCSRVLGPVLSHTGGAIRAWNRGKDAGVLLWWLRERFHSCRTASCCSNNVSFMVIQYTESISNEVFLFPQSHGFFGYTTRQENTFRARLLQCTNIEGNNRFNLLFSVPRSKENMFYTAADWTCILTTIKWNERNLRSQHGKQKRKKTGSSCVSCAWIERN